MSNSTSILDYLGRGTHAARPVTPPIGAGALAVYYETDTGNTFAWSGSAWVQLNGSAGSTTLAGDTDVAIASPATGQVLTYDGTASKWKNQNAAGGAGSTWPFAIVQYQEFSGSNNTITLEQTAASGNTLLALLGTNSADTPSITGYTQLFTKAQANYTQLTALLKAAAGTETAITTSGVSSGNNTTIIGLEISGVKSLDVQATASKVPGFNNATSWIQPPSITPATGAMVFAAASWCNTSSGGSSSGGTPYGFPSLLDPNWFPLLITPSGPSAARMAALWIYKGSGAASALQPGIIALPVLFDATAGITAATFSIK